MSFGEQIRPSNYKANWISLANQRQFTRINFNLFHYAGNNPVKYTDPTGNWFLLDDMLYSFIARVFGDQESKWWQGTVDSFIHSWEHPIEHGKKWYSYYKQIGNWADENYGISSYHSWHMQINEDSEIGVNINFSGKKATISYKKRVKKTNESYDVDLSKIIPGDDK